MVIHENGKHVLVSWCPNTWKFRSNQLITFQISRNVFQMNANNFYSEKFHCFEWTWYSNFNSPEKIFPKKIVAIKTCLTVTLTTFFNDGHSADSRVGLRIHSHDSWSKEINGYAKRVRSAKRKSLSRMKHVVYSSKTLEQFMPQILLESHSIQLGNLFSWMSQVILKQLTWQAKALQQKNTNWSDCPTWI